MRDLRKEFLSLTAASSVLLLKSIEEVYFNKITFSCIPDIFARIFLPGSWQDENAYTLQGYCAL